MTKLTDLEINKAVFSIVTGGKGCWHMIDLEIGGNFCHKCHEVQTYPGQFMHDGPDYINSKSDWADLIQFVVNEWEDREYEDFISSVQQDEPDYNEYSFPRHLLKGTRALPEALASWKEGE